MFGQTAMRKLFPLLALVCLVPGLANASPEPVASGYLEVAHGWVKRPDGSLVSIKGMMLPFKAWPISAKTLKPTKFNLNPISALAYYLENPVPSKNLRIKPRSSGGGPEADQVIYQADAGAGYGVAPDNPSSLDDITLSGGLNKPWQSLKFGFSTSLGNNPRFLIRWRIWQSNLDNPAPQNDFTGEIADFGVIWNVAIPGNQVVVEIGIAQASVSTSDSTLFIAQQFREVSNPPTPLQLQGEGDFMLGSVDTVFNGGAPPTVGSSDGTQFWYDWDPFPDGNYENSEIDTFEGAEANHVLGITVAGSGSVITFPMSTITPTIGLNPQGNVISTFQAFDNNEFKVEPNHTGARLDPIASIELSGFAAFGTVTGIRVSGVTTTTLGGLQRKVEMKNATNNTWVTLSDQVVGVGSSSFSESYGGTVPISQFLSGGNATFRIRWYTTSPNIPRAWTMGIDQFSATYSLQ